MIRALTVIDIEEWSAVFDGEKIVAEGHDTTVGDLVHLSRGEPFTLSRIGAHGTPLDAQISECGGFEGIMLTDALALARKRGRP